MTEKDKRFKALKSPAANEVEHPSLAVVTAIKALHAGTANDHQQQMGLDWIVRHACGKAHFPYHPNDRDTAFALGRYFVADLIVGLINADLSLRRAFDHADSKQTTRSAKA